MTVQQLIDQLAEGGNLQAEVVIEICGRAFEITDIDRKFVNYLFPSKKKDGWQAVLKINDIGLARKLYGVTEEKVEDAVALRYTDMKMSTWLLVYEEILNFAGRMLSSYTGDSRRKEIDELIGTMRNLRAGLQQQILRNSLRASMERGKEKRRSEEHDDLVRVMICQIIRQKEELKKAKEHEGAGSTAYINNAGALRGMQEMTCLIGGRMGYTIEELNEIGKREEGLRNDRRIQKRP